MNALREGLLYFVSMKHSFIVLFDSIMICILFDSIMICIWFDSIMICILGLDKLLTGPIQNNLPSEEQIVSLLIIHWQEEDLFWFRDSADIERKFI